MRFLRRLFSLRHKHKPPRADCRPVPAQSPQPAQTEQAETAEEEQDPDNEVEVVGVDGSDAVSHCRPPTEKGGKKEGDADAAVARLLRSASSNFNVVVQADYSDLPPLPHPINTVSSRSKAALAIAPTRTPSVQTKGSYRVIVHKRQQLSTTEFPNAYPPLTPRRPGIAHTSTPNLLATLSAPIDSPDVVTAYTLTPVLVDPRKVPITPRDVNRLSRLRQDPSIVSLLQMYDEHGRLAENAFANTPARQRSRARRSRTKSTFTELLGCEGTREADLLWAESCIARQVLAGKGTSNSSTSSLSSISTPPLDSPATSTFNDIELDRDIRTPGPAPTRGSSGSNATETEKEKAFSSLVVELSVATTRGAVDVDEQSAPYLGPYRYPPQERKDTEKEQEPETKGRRYWPSKAVADEDATLNGKQHNQNQTPGSKISRKPSQRASQVFNFIAERRERRKSQELLHNTVTPNVSDEPTHMNVPGESAVSDASVVGLTANTSRSRSSSFLATLPKLLTTKSSARAHFHPKSAPPVREMRNNDPGPAPPSPVTIHPLNPAPRPEPRGKSSSCSRATGSGILRAGSSASTSAVPLPTSTSGGLGGRPAKGSTGALVLLQAEREREKERKKAEALQWWNAELLPQTSTPHPSKIAKQKMSVKVSHETCDRALLSEVTNALAAGNDVGFDHTSFDNRYDAFAANLDMRSHHMREKENIARVASRRRGPPVDVGLTRASTTTFSHAPAAHKHMHRDGPQTPTRSQSLRGPENPSLRLTSELLPEATQLMADLHAHRALVRARSGREKQATNVA